MLKHPDRRDELRPRWLENRDEIMADYIKQFPGRRPWAWWICDAPRATVDDDMPKLWADRLIPARYVYDDAGRRVCLDLDAGEDWRQGVPWVHPHEDHAVAYESEAAWLLRHDLLTAAEKKRLHKGDFLPSPSRTRTRMSPAAP